MPDVHAQIRLLEERINLYARLLGRATSREKEREFERKIEELEHELAGLERSFNTIHTSALCPAAAHNG